MSKPVCYVMVGLPAIGKSTLIEGMYKPDTFIYSTDALLEEWAVKEGKTYDEVFRGLISKATTVMNSSLEIAIRERLDIIWDQANLGAGKRRKIINRMRQAGYQVRCECILPPESDYDGDKEDWVERLTNRPGKNIPRHVLSNMMENYVEPSIEEGFDMITFYNMHGALTAINYGEQK